MRNLHVRSHDRVPSLWQTPIPKWEDICSKNQTVSHFVSSAPGSYLRRRVSFMSAESLAESAYEREGKAPPRSAGSAPIHNNLGLTDAQDSGWFESIFSCFSGGEVRGPRVSLKTRTHFSRR